MSAENKGIYFTELTLKNVRCFGAEAVLRLSNDKGKWSRWNVILGDNGTGKTTLLQCLAGFSPISMRSSNQETSNTKYLVPMMRARDNGSLLKFDSINFGVVARFLGYRSLGYSGSRGKVETSSGIYGEEFDDLFVMGYGANRRISFQILSEKELEPGNSETLFNDDAKLFNTEEWLYQLDYAAAYAENNSTQSENYTKSRRDLVIKLLIEILPEIDEIKFIPKDDPSNPRPVMRFKTPYGWVGIHELSYGYKTMVAWIVDVAARMFKRYPTSPNPLHEPVVILVDEIDLHLHPRWQRQIFDFLESRFPRAQFIVTAHSPLIVQSAPADANIIVLRKEKEGDEYVVRIDNDVESVRNWRIDQIMTSDLFGIESARNPDIEAQMNERTELLQKTSLSDAEQARLEELNEISYALPTADNATDIKAMDLLRRAAKALEDKANKG